MARNYTSNFQAMIAEPYDIRRYDGSTIMVQEIVSRVAFGYTSLITQCNLRPRLTQNKVIAYELNETLDAKYDEKSICQIKVVSS